jgi:hypothetical protein
LVLSEGRVRRWEYKKINLNEVPRRGDEIDLLCEAGEEGWELVAILSNGITYLKREIEEDRPAEMEEPVAPPEAAASGHDVRAKYRDPVTGETWSGRGRMATWLKRKVDAGEDVDKYLV